MEKEKNIRCEADAHSDLDNLPAGRIGHFYRTIVDEKLFSVNNCTNCWMDGLEEIGLHFIPHQKQIAGMPEKTGDFNIRLNIRRYNDSGKESILTRDLKLSINEDLNIMPEEIPSDENDPYWKSDEDFDVQIISRDRKKGLKNMAAAGKRGRLHVQNGKFREDDFDIDYDPESRWYVLAVADGSGASEYSRKGSQIACKTATESCSRQLSAQSSALNSLANKNGKQRGEMAGILHRIIAASVVEAYRKIESEAKEHAKQPDDYATTLLLCICKKFEFGWFIGTFWVGDGAVCVYDKNRWFAGLLGVPDGGELSPIKRFLTMPGIIEPDELSRRIRFIVIKDFTALFLMTNGVGDPFFETDENLQYFEWWNKFWAEISDKAGLTGNTRNIGEKLLRWLDFWAPGKHDDRTVAVLF